ncbi:MAG TPA: four helix bundle protein [Candidatus Acidoferrales bacterium]
MVETQRFRGAKDFRDLEVWKWCRELRRDVESYCRRLPRHEQTRLADQMIRAARSVTANVAEGIGRYHYLETIQSCRMARGSLYELLDHLQVAVDNNYLKAAEFKAFDERIRSASRLLNGFVRYLRDRKDGAGKSRSTDKPINR